VEEKIVGTGSLNIFHAEDVRVSRAVSTYPHFGDYDINSEMELVITLLQVPSFLEKAAIRRTHENKGNLG